MHRFLCLGGHIMNKQKFLAKAKTLAKLMQPKGNIKIKIESGKVHQPRTDGQTIYIPDGDWSDPTFTSLIEWYIGHEAGHLKYTDFPLLNAELRSMKGIKGDMFNALEDAWMEREVCAEFLGMSAEFEHGVRLWKELGYFAEPNDSYSPERVLFTFVLCYGRAISVGQPLNDYADKAFKLLEERAGSKLAKEVKALVEQVKECTSTEGAIKIADDICKLLELESDNQDNQDNQDSQDSQDGQDGQDSQDGQNSQDGQGSQGNPAEFAADVLSAETLDEPDLHDALKEQIAEMAQTAAEEGKLGLSSQGEFSPLPIQSAEHLEWTEVDAEAQRNALVVQRAFKKSSLKKASKTNRGYDRSGASLDARFLSGIPAGNLDVFSVCKTRKSVGFNLHLLIDCSKSMEYYENMRKANNTAYSVLKGLESFANVKTSAYFYPYEESLLRVKSINKKVSTKMAVPAVGAMTPTGEAVQSLILDISSQQIANRQDVILIITDGICDPEPVKAAQELAETFGIRLCAIGIGEFTNDVMPGFEAEQYINIGSKGSLEEEILQLVKQNF